MPLCEGAAMPTMTPAVRMGLSIAAATGLYGLSFGALGVGAGLSIWQTCALSLLMFTGGSQFGFIGVVGAGGSTVTALSTAALLGVRNALYGIQMNALLKPPWALRPLQAHVTIDESTATAVAQEGDPDETRRGFWAAVSSYSSCVARQEACRISRGQARNCAPPATKRRSAGGFQAS